MTWDNVNSWAGQSHFGEPVNVVVDPSEGDVLVVWIEDDYGVFSSEFSISGGGVDLWHVLGDASTDQPFTGMGAPPGTADEASAICWGVVTSAVTDVTVAADNEGTFAYVWEFVPPSAGTVIEDSPAYVTDTQSGTGGTWPSTTPATPDELYLASGLILPGGSSAGFEYFNVQGSFTNGATGVWNDSVSAAVAPDWGPASGTYAFQAGFLRIGSPSSSRQVMVA